HYLDFEDFRRFVKLLKTHREINALYNHLKGTSQYFDFAVFNQFMRRDQRSTLPDSTLSLLFEKYSVLVSPPPHPHPSTSPPTTPCPSREVPFNFLPSASARPPLILSHTFTPSRQHTFRISFPLTVEGYIRVLLAGCRSVEIKIFDSLGSSASSELMVFHGLTLTTKVPLRQVCQVMVKYGFIASPYPIIISAENHCSIQGQQQTARIMIEEFCSALVRYNLDGTELGYVFNPTSPSEESGRMKIIRLPSPEELKGRILFKTENLMLGNSDSMHISKTSVTSSEPEVEPTSSASESNNRFGGLYRRECERIGKKGKKNADSSGDIFTANISIHLETPSSTHSISSAGPVTSQNPVSSPTLPPLAATLPVAVPSPILNKHNRSSTSPAVAPPSSYSYPYVQPSSFASVSNDETEDVDGTRRVAHLHYRSSISGIQEVGTCVSQSDETGSMSDMKSTKSKLSTRKSSKDKDGVGDEEEWYAPEHMFSSSENTANEMLRTSTFDLIKHTEGHLVRVYPRGTRMRSTNFEPHRYWSAGCQLLAINWQTFDLGYVINHAMSQRNAAHSPDKRRKNRHVLKITIIPAQQLPRVKIKDGSGHEVLEGRSVDSYVEVSLHVPEWTYCVSPTLLSTSTFVPSTSTISNTTRTPQPETPLQFTTTSPEMHTLRTHTIKNNGFNPIWNQTLSIPFDAPTQPGMLDLMFLRLLVEQESSSSAVGGIPRRWCVFGW
ncbi:1-phosphatidylinositol 4,5-bisphosphate phosphodiesterase delta-4, partial [Leucoagaricus sp. SymC.cos]